MRLFKTHNIRRVEQLDGSWELFTLDDNGNRTGSYSAIVPACWESIPALATYRGKAVYSRKISVIKESNLRFVFGGVSHTADIYLDGKHLAHHYNAYTGFAAKATAVSAGEHILEVFVDNSYGEHSSLHIPNDYNTYGGIIRPVSLEYIEDSYISSLKLTPKKQGESWKLEAQINIQSSVECTARLNLCFNGEEINAGEHSLQIGNKNYPITVDAENIQEWSPDSPKLYEVTAKLIINGDVADDLIERFGFREITWEQGKLQLNGQEIFLKGFNRHEDLGGFGCAIPVAAMARDLDLIAGCGANSVRTAHYPNDERFLDLCDERGILVWEESHARGLTEEKMRNPNFRQQSIDCIEEMLNQHYNHPSIIIWGILNECASDTDYGRECYAQQLSLIDDHDKSRPKTHASNRHFWDKTLDMVDILSFNIYPGWYNDDDPAKLCKSVYDYAVSAGGKGKPFIVSEFGGAAIYGFHSPERFKWSEERQCDILESCITRLRDLPFVSGLFIWQFSDCRVSEQDCDFTRPMIQNNKGVVDLYRRPKLAYYKVKELFSEKS